MDAKSLLDRYFLEMRSGVIELAAALDRLDRAESLGAIDADARLEQLRIAMGLLVDGKPDRAGRVQMVFSDAYDPEWQEASSARV